MSPLATLILRFMRAGSIGAAGFMVLVIGIELWKHWRAAGLTDMARQDVTFLIFLVVMLVACLWLARAIAREIARHS